LDATELDTAIEELETRVERLRALYEQFFMGIEKIPPQVVQKDVDRRLYVLKREQIRNTARRFKLQTIIQRYNTFQQYWMRIMREIENGTYRRHVLRAERTVGVTNLLTAAERKRLGLPEATSSIDPAQPNVPVSAADTSTVGEPAAPLDTPKGELGPNTHDGEALEPREPERQHEGAPAERVRREIERDLGRFLDDDLDDLAKLSKFEMGTELDDPLLSSLPPPPPAAPKRPPVAPLVPPVSTATGPRGLRLPAHSAIAGRGLPPPLKATAPRTAVPATTSPKPIGADFTKPSGLAKPQPPSEATPNQSPNVTARMPPDSSPRGLPDIRESVIPRSSRPAPHLRLPVGIVAAAPKVPRVAVPRHAAPENPGERDAVDRNMIAKVAEKLQTARKQTNEGGAVSIEALTRKLETTAAELRKKHAGKRVDFDVIIKDGKAIVKPIVR
jgi:hypothetical protein